MSHCFAWPLALLATLALGCGASSTAGDGDGGGGAGASDAGADVHHDAQVDVAADVPDDRSDVGQEDAVNDSESGLSCGTPTACDAPHPDLGDAREFRHTSSKITAAIGSPRHRGRDLFLLEGATQWVLGKFAYGVLDDDIKDEDIDIYVLRDCGDTWTFAGTFPTTHDGDHATVQGVEDTGGRIYVDIASTGIAPLGVGRHRVLMVVGGDLSWAEQIIEVVRPDAKIVVTDIDGTLTSSEYAAVTDVVGLPPAEAHAGAADLMKAFEANGYHLFYLTARPEWMMTYSRDWLPMRGFPPGVVHTTLSGVGALGAAATTYKQDELAWLANNTGIVPSFAFGNKDSDVEAYVGAGIDPAHCYYFDLSSDLKGGTNVTDYTTLIPTAQSAPPACW